MSDKTRVDDETRPAYEPPRIEQVLTGEVLAREVHYAGAPTGDSSDGAVDA